MNDEIDPNKPLPLNFSELQLATSWSVGGVTVDGHVLLTITMITQRHGQLTYLMQRESMVSIRDAITRLLEETGN